MKKSVATEIVELVKDSGAMLFLDQYKESYALLPERPCHGVNIRSGEFKIWLSKLAYTQLQKAPNSESLKSACNVLEGMTHHGSATIPLHIRVGTFTNDGVSKIYYDLGNGNFVEISAAGWEIAESSPIWFRPLQHQQRQNRPEKGGDIRELLKFINLSEEAREHGAEILILTWIISSFISDYPHPILVVHGPHGSAKSTLFSLLKTLIDPSSLTKMSPPNNQGDFAVAASRHWFLPYDNLSYLPEWLSDAMCRACTGDGISKRSLFTNGDEHIVSFRIVLGINGISLVVDKPDLLDRSILLELKPLAPENRQSEKNFWQEFEEKRPLLLGAIFDVLAGALKEYPKVELKALPRMADFACWGVAIARAMGLGDEAFFTAYKENIHDQHEEAVDANPIARCVLEFMANKNEWESSPTELLAELNDLAQRLKIDTKGKLWPKDSGWLWRRLIMARNNLEAMGYLIDRAWRNGQRVIFIRQCPKNDVAAVGTDLFSIQQQNNTNTILSPDNGGHLNG